MSRLPAIRAIPAMLNRQHLNSRLGSSIFPRISPRTYGLVSPFVFVPIGCTVFSLKNDRVTNNGNTFLALAAGVVIAVVAQFALD